MTEETELDEFVNNLHPSSKLLSRGKATVLGNTSDAVMILNLYGQRVVWGMFSVQRGKYKGKLANNSNTEDVKYRFDLKGPEVKFGWVDNSKAD